MNMSQEYSKLPHEIVNLSLRDWSFNLLCMVENSKEVSEHESKGYSKEATRVCPQLKDKVYLDELSKYSNKLPMWGLNNG